MNIKLSGLIVGILLTFNMSCSKRVTEGRKSSVDSLTESRGHKNTVDTTKSGTYTRFIGYMPIPSLKTSAPFNPFKYPGMVLQRVGSDSAKWSPADFVEYLKMLDSMDSIPELAPFYYERWTSEEKGTTTTSDTATRTKVKKEVKEKATERKPDMSWKIGLVIIIIAIVLIAITSKRKLQ